MDGESVRTSGRRASTRGRSSLQRLERLRHAAHRAADPVLHRASSAVPGVLEGLVDGLFPPLCPLCREVPLRGRTTCAAHALPDPALGPRGPRCGRCARALPPMLADGDRCAACRRRAPAFHRLVVLGDYRDDAGLREWILALKHGGRRDLAPWLGQALARRLGTVVSRGVLLVPVPLHPLRRFERGYDQARLLAEATAEGAGSRAVRLLARTRWTPAQGALGSVSRRANVRDAFAPARWFGVELAGVAVWLVDDVVTSGATLDACARALHGLGARRVSALALARAGERADRDHGEGA